MYATHAPTCGGVTSESHSSLGNPGALKQKRPRAIFLLKDRLPTIWGDVTSKSHSSLQETLECWTFLQACLQAQHLPAACASETWPGYRALTLSEQGMTTLYLCRVSGNTDDHSGPSDFWLVSGKILDRMGQPWVVYSWIFCSLKRVA